MTTVGKHHTKRSRLKISQTASSVFPNLLGIHQIHVFGFVGAVQREKRQNAVGGKVEADADDAVVRIEFDSDQCGDGRADDGGEIICQRRAGIAHFGREQLGQQRRHRAEGQPH